MPRPRPPYVWRQVTRHGSVVWYFKRSNGKRTRLPAPGTPEFDAAYAAALTGLAPLKPGCAPSANSLAWLIARYRETSTWLALSARTRKQYDYIFLKLISAAGSEPATNMTEQLFEDALARRTPGAALNFYAACRALSSWAKKSKHIEVNPTAAVKAPKLTNGGGFPIWSEADAITYEKRWPVGTRQRVWFDVLIYTGGRVGDAVRLGPSHLSDGALTFQTEKSHFQTEVTIPILPELAGSIAAGPCGTTAFICGARGNALDKFTFGNEFRNAARSAGINKSAHGVRKLAAVRWAYRGVSNKVMDAIFGWKGGGMAELYTKTAERHKLSKLAFKELLDERRAAGLAEQPAVAILRPVVTRSQR